MEAASFSGNKELEMEATEILYQIYKSQNNKDRALFYYEMYHTLQDSLFNEKNIKQIARLEANYEFENEKQQLAFQRKQEIEQQKFFSTKYVDSSGSCPFVYPDHCPVLSIQTKSQ